MTNESPKIKRPPRGKRKPVPLNGRRPATEAGRAAKVHVFSNSEIDRMVTALIRSDRSFERRLVLDLLYRYVALTEETLFRLVHEQVAISDNPRCFNAQLSRYRKDGLIADLPSIAVRQALRAGLPEPTSGRQRAYCLGPVGEAYVARKGWSGNAPSPSLTEEHLVHDLVCAETMLHMRALWANLPTDRRGVVDVCGPRQVVVWDSEKKAYLAAPDGLLIKHTPQGAFERAFVVEYHNTNSVLNVQQKIKRYEELAKEEYAWLWNDHWGLDRMPIVLVLYRQQANYQHYMDELSQRAKLRAMYAATSLEAIWAGNLTISVLYRPSTEDTE